MIKLALVLIVLLPLNSFAETKSNNAVLNILGKEMTMQQLGNNPEQKVRAVIMTQLWKRMSEEQNIKANDEEIANLKKFFDNAIGEAVSQSADKLINNFEMPEAFVKDQIIKWKIDKKLFEKYGGRVRFQQSGPEPLDAYRDFLKEQEANELFSIKDEGLKEAFWAYFEPESSHHFYPDEVGKEIMSKPMWEHSKSF